jgi:hypothetical protein
MVGRAAGQRQRQGGGSNGSTAKVLAELDRRQQHSSGKKVAGRRWQRSRIRAVLRKAARWQWWQSGSESIRKHETGGGIEAAKWLC